MSRQTWRFDSLGVHRVIELGRVLINEHQSKRWGSVCFTPESGREASLLKESALCHKRTSNPALEQAIKMMSVRFGTRTRSIALLRRTPSILTQTLGVLESWG
jgi:hypothetical protein